MPQRTNEFQHLVKLIHQALAPNSAKVTESAMVKVPKFGDVREIDVLIETEVSPYKIKIAVEAKDHGVKLDLTDIDAFAGKYRGTDSVVVDKVVIVSRRGFSKRAIGKAKAIGFELFTLNEVSEQDWQSLAPPAFRGTTMNFQMNPHIAQLRVLPDVPPELVKEAMTKGKLICKCCGKVKGTPLGCAEHYLNCHALIDPGFVKMCEDTLAKFPHMCGKVSLPYHNHHLVWDKYDLPVEALDFHVHATRMVAPLRFKAYDFAGESGSRRMTHGKAEFPNGNSIEMLFPDGEKSQKIAVDFNINCF
jgi:hypothetical protein